MSQEVTKEELLAKARKLAEDAMKLHPLVEKLKEKSND